MKFADDLIELEMRFQRDATFIGAGLAGDVGDGDAALAQGEARLAS